MGGMFKAITPPTPKATQSVVQPQAQAPSQVQATATTVEVEKERRKEALARQHSGRAGTIATSPRGLLLPAEWLPARKSLLGE
jgi:hypothetical protein